MGIGDRYVYTMGGIGEKALIHGLFRKITTFIFFAFSEYSATTQTTWKTDFWPKKGQKQGYSLIQMRNKRGNRERNRAFLFESRQERPRSL